MVEQDPTLSVRNPFDEIRLRRDTTVLEDLVAGGKFEKGHLVGAERDRRARNRSEYWKDHSGERCRDL